MPALDPTVGGPSANTWADLAFYKAYIDSRSPRPTWAAAALSGDLDEELTRDLITSCRLLGNSFAWTGIATNDDQALPWPQKGQLYRNGRPIPEDVIPYDLKLAQCELGVQLRDATVSLTTPDYIREGIKSVATGTEKVEFQSASFSFGADVLNNLPENRFLSLIPGIVSLFLVPSWYTSPTPEIPSDTNRLIFKVF